MVSKRSLYLKIITVLSSLFIFFVLNSAILNDSTPNVLYKLIAWPKSVPTKISSAEINADSLLRENAILRKQLGLNQKVSQKILLCKIIAIQRNSFSSVIVIDKGSEDGLKSGMVVFQAGNVLVGRIDQVYKNSSSVKLIDDPEFIISVKLFKKDLIAESRGSLSGAVEFNLIAHSDVITQGDTLISSGLDAFPVGFSVAEVSDISPGQNSLFQKIKGQTFFSLHENPYLFILL